jgi:hypothetical protein
LLLNGRDTALTRNRGRAIAKGSFVGVEDILPRGGLVDVGEETEQMKLCSNRHKTQGCGLDLVSNEHISRKAGIEFTEVKVLANRAPVAGVTEDMVKVIREIEQARSVSTVSHLCFLPGFGLSLRQ